MINMILAILVLFPFIAGLLTYGFGKTKAIANILAVISVAVEFGMILFLVANLGQSVVDGVCTEAIKFSVPEICGFGLHFVMDGFRMVYVMIAGLMWLMTTVLSGEYFLHHENVNRFYLFLLWTLGATVGVFLSADFYTTFIFFEIMSFTSYVWVAQEENRPALRAAETYLAVAVIGGLVMLMGIFLLYNTAKNLGVYTVGNPLYFEELNQIWVQTGSARVRIAGLCMLFGFGAKAGAFPLHIWLPKAHPVAPAPASALLSGILTKTGIYGTLLLSCRLFYHDKEWGKLILVLGVITMFGGALLAVFSIDLKRTLACSSMSQIGFILVGVGMQGMLGEENALAVHGTVLHMANHSMIKLVLFMAAGVVYMNAHSLDLNEIRGFGRKKPILGASFLTGALAIGGIPLFSGYVSKTLLHEAIVEYKGGAVMTAAEWIFLISGGLTVAYMTKLFIAIFVEKNNSDEVQKKYDSKKKYMNPASIFALGGSALILFLWGIVPSMTMNKIAKLSQDFMGLEEYGHEVHYFSLENLKGGLISIGIGVLVYLLFIRKVLLTKENKYVNLWPTWLDLENMLYRPLLISILPVLFSVPCRVLDCLADTIAVVIRKTILKDSPLPHERVEGNIFTTTLGRVMNGLEAFGNRHWHKKMPHMIDYQHVLAIKNEEFKENNRIISRSLSFGLLLFGVGLSLTLIYLIWW